MQSVARQLNKDCRAMQDAPSLSGIPSAAPSVSIKGFTNQVSAIIGALPETHILGTIWGLVAQQ